ncbi:MAG: hypothetical protein KatS3mg087_2020 [Patescibacteria group bacterium]|nr:MAG: hypothetical protein KatS3mg087_2020 [Patescibacteria group bacterium]
MSWPRYAFAGDREIAVKILKFLLGDVPPKALMISHPNHASHSKELRELCSFLPPEYVFVGSEFRSRMAIDRLKELDLDLIISIHFPYLFTKPILEIPKIGILNLHPAYLPFNRGWHTVTWAILENTPIGATLHFVDEGIDSGDIVHQRALEIQPDDTAHKLYQRLLELEYQVFKEAWEQIKAGNIRRIRQDPSKGTFHLKKDLFDSKIQKLDLNSYEKVGDLLRKLRALTTNRLEEAAYFEVDGRRYYVQITITPEASASK